MFLLASVATAGVALWLFWVIAVVLPARDPEHIPMWRTIAVCCLAYGVLSWAHLVAGARRAVLRWPVLAVSVAAIGLGLYGIVGMLRRANAGGHFEGYIVLMGTILCVHGLAAIAYTLIAERVDSRAHSV